VVGLHVAVRASDTLEEAMNAGLSAGTLCLVDSDDERSHGRTQAFATFHKQSSHGVRSCQKSSKSSKLSFTGLPSERDPQVDRGERPNSPPDGGGWFIGLESSALSFLRCDSLTGALLGPGNASIGTMDMAT
jgi:hypothetical protein